MRHAPSPTLSVALTLAGEPSATIRALRHVLKSLLRTFGVRCVRVEPVANQTDNRGAATSAATPSAPVPAPEATDGASSPLTVSQARRRARRHRSAKP
jgi:hypothetical protein